MKKTLGLVVPDLSGDGGVPAVARFVKDAALRSGRYDLRLISLSMSGNDECSVLMVRPSSFFKGVRTKRGVWEELNFTHVGANLGDFEFQRYRSRDALKRCLSGCDVVQVISGSPAWANAVLDCGVPISLQVATLARVERRQRDSTSQGAVKVWRKSMTYITDRLDNKALKSVNAIQVENAWMYDLVRNLNQGRDVDIKYAPPGVDDHLFCPRGSASEEKGQYLLCVGRLSDPRKNVNLLAEAYALLSKRSRDNFILVLAGASSPPSEFWSKAERLGILDRIKFIHRPSQDELIKIYQNAYAFLLSSDEEGLGVVILEAMACGVPVVATRCGGPEGIITHGADGYLVPISDSVAMASHVEQLLNDSSLRDAMGVQARSTIEKRYAESVAGKVFVETWDRLTGSE